MNEKDCPHPVGETEILDEGKRLVKCKLCGQEDVLEKKLFTLLKSLLDTLQASEKALEMVK